MPADPLSNLVEELSRLPGIGPKTARRLAHHLLRADRSRAEALAQAVIDVKDRMIHCSTCHQITAVDPCSICSDPQRDRTKLCVVEEPFNIEPIERTGEFHGLYHALLGALSPQRGVGPGRTHRRLSPGPPRRSRRGDPRHEPQRRRRSHRPLPRQPPQPPRRPRHPPRLRPSPSAATSTTPTRSPSRVHWRVAAICDAPARGGPGGGSPADAHALLVDGGSALASVGCAAVGRRSG